MIRILFGIHAHQPVDNFYNVVNEAINKSYKPFLKTVMQSKTFRFSIHFSGWLLEYIKTYDKEMFNLLKSGADNNSLEFFTGGFYEPILASIPSDDRKKQVEKLSNFIWDNFGQKPKGLWLTERIWENSIVKDMSVMGIEYVIVDDYHFINVGFKKSKLNGYYLTEENGSTIKAFPIDKNLRYMIPFRSIEKIESYLHSLNDATAIIFDDAEKFGIWPRTYKWIYEQHWLDSFLNMISTNNNIECTLFKEYINSAKPLGLAYLPSTSYYEMGQWSLSEDSREEIELLKEKLSDLKLSDYFEKYVKGSIWKNFFIKYKESNKIHKRMLKLSKSNERVKSNTEFMDWLFKAQCNDVFWHGIFGGLYLPNLRDNAYKFIIQAHTIMDNILNKNAYSEIDDINMDGYDEILLSNKNTIYIFDSKVGGQLTELSIKDKAFNLQNTITRRKESYHNKLVLKHITHQDSGVTIIHEMDLSISQNIKNMIKYDWYDRNSFIDHITDKNINIENFKNCNFKEYSDFVNMPFDIKETELNSVTFMRNGGIYLGKKYDTTIKKLFVCGIHDIKFNIDLQSAYNNILIYLLEFNFHFMDIRNVNINNQKMRESMVFNNIQSVDISDTTLNKRLIITLNCPFKLLTFTVNTISQSENGIELTPQGQSFGLCIEFYGELSLNGLLVINNI